MSARAKIDAFRAQLADYMGGTRRAEQTSTLFDLPLRSMLGGACFYENLPELLDRLDREPEQIGARMRQLGHRPYLMHANAMMFGFLTGRQERLAEGGAEGTEERRAERLVGFWERLVGACREEGTDFSRRRQRILDEEMLAGELSRLGAARGRHPFARQFALLQNLNFLLHGESRDGLFDHGPYAEAAGSCVVVRELTDLRGGLHSWAEPSGAAALPFDRVVAIRRVDVRPEALAFDMFGTMAAPGVDDFNAAIGAEIVLAGDGGPDSPLRPVEELAGSDEVAGQVREVNRALLGIFAGFSDEQRISYGVDMYANMLVGFGRIGADDPAGWERRLRSCFAGSAERALARMRSSSAAGDAWRSLDPGRAA